MPMLKKATFSPCNEKHSIERCEVNFVFEADLGDHEMGQLLDVVRSSTFMRGFFTSAKFKETEVAIQNDTESVDEAKSTITAIRLEKVDNSSTVEWRAIVTTGAFLITCFSYTRWKYVLPAAMEILQELFVCMDKVPVQTVSLMYNDVFTIDASKTDLFDITKLFRKGSPYVPKGFINAAFPIKSSFEAGIASDSTGSRYTREVVDIGVHYSKSNEPLGYYVKTEHTIVDIDKSSHSFGKKGNSQDIEVSLGQLHHYSKRVLAELLTSQVLRKIGMVN